MGNAAPREVAAGFSLHARAGLSAAPRVPECSRACLFGIDASAVAGELVSDAADDASDTEVPVLRDLRVPGWVSGGTLTVVLSMTGDEPRLAGLLERLAARGAAVACIAPEGDLTRSCEGLGGHAVAVPADLDPGAIVMFMAGAAAGMVQSAGLFPAADLLEAALDRLVSDDYAFPDSDGIAGRLGGRVPAVYSTSDTRACARWWKCLSVGRGLAFSGDLPEFDHNELVGWSDSNVHAPELGMVVLRGRRGPGLVDDIVGCMEEVLSENGRPVVSVPLGEGPALVRDIRGMAVASAVHMGAVR